MARKHIEVKASPELLELTNGVPFAYKTLGSCAVDLMAVRADEGNVNNWSNKKGDVDDAYYFNTKGEMELGPGEQMVFDPGLKIWLGATGDRHLTGLVLPRSGMGSKGLVLGNTLGLIDNDYQGTLFVVLWNRSPYAYVIKRGDRIAQYMINRSFVMMTIEEMGNRTRTFDMADNDNRLAYRLVEQFSNETQRGEGGFGHTGK